ncbi:MAG: polysaccharide deacetylase family protein [Actinomycetota bacterium]
MTESVQRPVRRRPRQRIRFTRRFYVLLGGIALLVLVIILISALASGGGGESIESAVSMVGGMNEGELYNLKVNELGAVMVLEYHKIGEEGRWSRTPENLRADLEFLYNEGYRCVSMKDYATNNIAVEAGYTPVVLTYDDSDPSQFRYIEENGQTVIDPRCAMGVMEQFDRDYPDFNITATFYVEPRLFGQDEYIQQKLDYLVANGYDIGNHCVTHPELAKLDDTAVQEEITGNIEAVQAYLPGYEEKSLALPYGSEPANKSLALGGSTDGITYSFVASLLVGANPAPSPCDYSFDPVRVPRVQALDPSLDTGDSGIYAWIQYFMENPERRFRSDGNPGTVTVPKHMIDRVDQSKLGDRELKTY